MKKDKLGDMFTELNGIDLPIEDFDFPISVYNALRRGGILNLKQLLSMSEDELKLILKQKFFDYIISTLSDFNTNGIPWR